MPCYAAGAGQEDSLGGGAGRSPHDCARPAQQRPDRAAPAQHCRSGGFGRLLIMKHTYHHPLHRHVPGAGENIMCLV